MKPIRTFLSGWWRRILLVPLGSLLALTLFSCLIPERELPTIVHFEKAPTMRVLLAKNIREASIGLHGPFKIVDAHDPEETPAQGKMFGERVLKARSRYGFSFGELGVGFDASLLVPSEGQTIAFNGRSYRGRFLFVKKDEGFDVVNLVDLESYLCGVIGAEMPLSWPDEALRAQAIAARSYAIYNLSRRTDRDYDVYADTRSQVYKGVEAETDKARRIVASTSGLLVTDQGELFCSYFHSTCGGETVPAEVIFDETPSTVLSGTRCGFCSDSKYFKPWTYSIDAAELAAKLRAKGKDLGPVVQAAWVENPIGGSNVHRVLKLKGSLGIVEFEPYVFRRQIFSSLKGPAYTVELRDGAVVFEGVGFGHNVGMCQYGAYGLAKRDYKAEQILAHFYPGCQIAAAY